MASELILVVGAADTGRAPMTAAVLQQRLAEHGHTGPVGSAGVLGHDDEPATGEAIAAMEQMGLDLGQHRARSLTAELADAAVLLIAVDGGAAKVAAARFPQAAGRIYTLGALAGRPRDIPDPFKMQIGAWLAYAREIDQLIAAALPRILSLLPAAQESAGSRLQPPTSSFQPLAPERVEAAERIVQLVRLAAQLPGVVDWAAARGQIEADLGRIAALPAPPGDMAPAYTGMLRAALALTPAPPSPGKLAALAEAAGRLAAPLPADALADLSAQLGGWAAL
ncbi:MAG TPA: protein tyrosine phosphatase [Roseiflexaceae bacterium]|nr:protein tyrosine phosphatase [Roseiflexaceae bacterium]